MRLLVFLAAFASGCEAWPYDDAVQYEPPATYLERWLALDGCSQRQGDFSRLNFYFIPSESHSIPPGHDGSYKWPHTITVREWAIDSLGIVAHEMMHDRLWGEPGNKEHTHPAGFACADSGLVARWYPDP